MRSSRRIALTLVAVAALCGAAWAHYPMLLTDSPMVERGEPIEIEYTIGHPFWNDRHAVHKPEKVRVYPPQRRAFDLTASVTSLGTTELPRWRVRYTPRSSGDHVFSFHGGLYHEPPQRTVADYSKLIIHVKHETGAQVGWHRVLQDPLEILPLTRPYAIPTGSVFRGQVLASGQAMPEMIVDAETYAPGHLQHEGGYLPKYRLGVRTDDQGVFAVTLPKPGWWILSTATDGGPGEQGTSSFVARRATLWVHVGDTEFDHPTVGPGSGGSEDEASDSRPSGSRR